MKIFRVTYERIDNTYHTCRQLFDNLEAAMAWCKNHGYDTADCYTIYEQVDGQTVAKYDELGVQFA